MSQPSVTAYFNTRKRQACDELRGKSKILLLERDNQAQTTTTIESKSAEQSASDETSLTGSSPKIMLRNDNANFKDGIRANKAIRNIQFDSSKVSRPKMRATRSRTLPSTIDESQTDIRESFSKVANDPEIKKVPFEKIGTLSPKKKSQQIPKKASAAISKISSKKKQKRNNLSTYLVLSLHHRQSFQRWKDLQEMKT